MFFLAFKKTHVIALISAIILSSSFVHSQNLDKRDRSLTARQIITAAGIVVACWAIYIYKKNQNVSPASSSPCCTSWFMKTKEFGYSCLFNIGKTLNNFFDKNESSNDPSSHEKKSSTSPAPTTPSIPIEECPICLGALHTPSYIVHSIKTKEKIVDHMLCFTCARELYIKHKESKNNSPCDHCHPTCPLCRHVLDKQKINNELRIL